MRKCSQNDQAKLQAGAGGEHTKTFYRGAGGRGWIEKADAEKDTALVQKKDRAQTLCTGGRICQGAATIWAKGENSARSETSPPPHSLFNYTEPGTSYREPADRSPSVCCSQW